MADGPEAATTSAPETTSKKREQKSRNGRKNAAAACDSCRRKRTRCIPAETEGNPCQGCASSQLECRYTGHDRRRGTVQDLRTKLSQFEQFFSNIEASTSLSFPLHSNASPSNNRSEVPSEGSLNDRSFSSHNEVYNDETNDNNMDDTGYGLPDQRSKRPRLDTASPPVPSFTIPESRQSSTVTLPAMPAFYPASSTSPAPIIRPTPLPIPTASSNTASASRMVPRILSQSCIEATPLIADCLAIEEGGIRAYGPTSNQTLAAENPRTSGQAIHQTTDKNSDKRIPPPSTLGGLSSERSSLLAAAAKNIESVPLGTGESFGLSSQKQCRHRVPNAEESC